MAVLIYKQACWATFNRKLFINDLVAGGMLFQRNIFISSASCAHLSEREGQKESLDSYFIIILFFSEASILQFI